MTDTGFAQRLTASFSDIDVIFPRPSDLPETDDLPPDDEFETAEAEGQTFAIEYIDSAGQKSVRRISVWNVNKGKADSLMLRAFCHERKAIRAFRVDRIQSCITIDGEIFDDVPTFLAETFGLNSSLFRSSSLAQDLWASILAIIRPDAVLLAAMARADGQFLHSEVIAAEDYLLRRAETSGIMMDESMVAALLRYYRGLRPTEKQIETAMERIASRDPNAIMNFLVATVEVMRADGRQSPEEVELINEMAVELTGMPVIN
ncbi:WYL domain-containing protein [uncultured Martelella sp.]|uniref:tellurite resistance TerB family protein n=1 Tax=uncultured Martelella sp. TaxID=392331 RepID=UPI0029C7AFF4|nr:WYL domain-containing protein [uncultured Martelella sp.]